jgi:hypothetical protein
MIKGLTATSGDQALDLLRGRQYRTDAMLTLDRRGFRAVRPLTPHKWFRLLPDDLEQQRPRFARAWHFTSPEWPVRGLSVASISQ